LEEMMENFQINEKEEGKQEEEGKKEVGMPD
jgi:hypothetical protein